MFLSFYYLSNEVSRDKGNISINYFSTHPQQPVLGGGGRKSKLCKKVGTLVRLPQQDGSKRFKKILSRLKVMVGKNIYGTTCV